MQATNLLRCILQDSSFPLHLSVSLRRLVLASFVCAHAVNLHKFWVAVCLISSWATSRNAISVETINSSNSISFGDLLYLLASTWTLNFTRHRLSCSIVVCHCSDTTFIICKIRHLIPSSLCIYSTDCALIFNNLELCVVSNLHI